MYYYYFITNIWIKIKHYCLTLNFFFYFFFLFLLMMIILMILLKLLEELVSCLSVILELMMRVYS